MQSMTRSMSLNFNSKRGGGSSNSNSQQNPDDLEAFDSGETIALKNFVWCVRSYGTCGNIGTPYVPSPSSHANRYRKCLTHIVSDHETLAGIALKYDITVEDLRRTNSFLWTSNSVWVGQTLKIPIFDFKNQQQHQPLEQQQSSINKKRKNSEPAAAVSSSSTSGVGSSSVTDFWTKVDDSIEASKKVTNQFKKQSEVNSTTATKDPLKC